MNDLWIKKISIKDNKRIEIEFDMSGKWKRYVYNKKFFCEYNIEINSVPDSLMIIPLLGNLLPIAWLYNLNICIDVLDKSFYEYLPKVLQGYENMYPNYQFHNNLKVKCLEDNDYINNKIEACFFSGGVDAYYTFLRHRNSISAITTVWGSDVKLEDYIGWENVYKAVSRTSEMYGVKKYIIKSNFREVLNTDNLSYDLKHDGWSWWHEFQHGMGLITLMAPVAYIEKISCLYIASSYTSDIKNLTCASDPSIDNYVRFNNCKVIHDGFESNRQQKIKYIVDYSKKYNKSIDLRVCWISQGGKNCCVCEKCCRTMTALLLENGELERFGFNNKYANSKKIAKNMKYKNSALPRDWNILHERLHEKYTKKTVPKEWRWFYKGGTSSINNNFIYRVKRKTWHFLKKVIGCL